METKKNYGKNRRSEFFEQTRKEKSVKKDRFSRTKRNNSDENYADKHFSSEKNFSNTSFERKKINSKRKEDNRNGFRIRKKEESFGFRDNKRRKFHSENNQNEQSNYKSKRNDSDILREIVQKRKTEGRQSARKQKILSLSWNEERGPIRLNKYIANSGICSRREADDLIVSGSISVNGQVVTELGTKVLPTDEVRFGDKILQREKPVYILLNKPKNFITTTEDERDRDSVMQLIAGACSERVYPVGRLDRNTTGLLLFTNDGELTKKLTHPQFEIEKIYQVELDRNMTLADFETLKNGIELYDGFIKPDELEFVDNQKNILGITLHSGKNRIVRRMFGYFGYDVEKLDRVYFAGLTKKDLPRGQYRFLTPAEIGFLKRC